MPPPIDRNTLDDLYARYNRREFVHPDPLEFLYDYEEHRDREVAALVASSLAYGRVAQILKSVSLVLERMGSPWEYLKRISGDEIRRRFADFRHRFATGEELSAVLFGVKHVMERYGSMNACFLSGYREDDETVLPALSAFVKELKRGSDGRCGHLMPAPESGSACKRLNLFLRWMVRRDDVDPGGWDGVPKSKLLIPLDTHMHKIGLSLGLTERKQADMRTVLEITAGFRRISPDDPVRYDFALTRLGIRADTDLDAFLEWVGMPEVEKRD